MPKLSGQRPRACRLSDFSAELSKARNAKPDAIFVFYPGAAGIQFLTQYAQMGLKGRIPLYTAEPPIIGARLQDGSTLMSQGGSTWVHPLRAWYLSIAACTADFICAPAVPYFSLASL